MNVRELSSALPKPWLRVNSGVGICDIPLYSGVYVTAAAADVLTLSAEQAVSGVLVVLSGRSAGISLPFIPFASTFGLVPLPLCTRQNFN